MGKVNDVLRRIGRSDNDFYYADYPIKRQHTSPQYNGEFAVGMEVINLKTKKIGVITESNGASIKVLFEDGMDDAPCFNYRKTGNTYPQVKYVINQLRKKNNE